MLASTIQFSNNNQPENTTTPGRRRCVPSQDPTACPD
jgi:hypothetical protein